MTEQLKCNKAHQCCKGAPRVCGKPAVARARIDLAGQTIEYRACEEHWVNREQAAWERL